MINLIPKEERVAINKRFYIRLGMLVLFAVGGAGLFVLFAVLPSFWLSHAKLDIAENKLMVQQSEPIPAPDQQTALMVEDLNKKLEIVELASKSEFSLTEDIINAVVLKKPANIKITDLSFVKDSAKGPSVAVEGIAPSREALLAFRQALEDSGYFSQVDLPISNFVKGENIEYSLSLIPILP